MGARSTGREAALQMLFALEASERPVEEVIREFWREMPGDAEGRSYADTLVRGVAEQIPALDERIRASSRNWRLERMTRVDRNLLRLGVFELANDSGTPHAVVIDEAVELAKRFGSEGSSSFVNGVLDNVAATVGETRGGGPRLV